jgi:DNA polymerase (family 10)
MDWRWGIKAAQSGIMTSINPDAHQLEGLSDVRFGVGIARKAWYTKALVLNTFSADEIREFFAQFKR